MYDAHTPFPKFLPTSIFLLHLSSRLQICFTSCSLLKKRENTEVYIVKKFQDYNYEKLLSAYNYAESGYGQVGLDRNKSRAKTQLIKAINIFPKMQINCRWFLFLIKMFMGTLFEVSPMYLIFFPRWLRPNYGLS